MRAFLLGATPSFELSQAADTTQKLAKTGGNTGNQLIARGLLDVLRLDYVSWDYSVGPDVVNKEFDFIIIAAANFLFPGFDFSGMAEFISKTNLPCMMVGLGAQSNDYSTDIPLQKGTVRLVQIVSDRSAFIGVRGAFTAEVLKTLGISNVQVTGCPSHYMTGEPDLLIKTPAIDFGSKLAINSSRDVISHAFDRDRMKHAVRALASEAVRYNADFVAQSELDEIMVADTSGDRERDQAVNRIYEFYKGVSTQNELRKWIDSHLKVFWSIDDWIQYIDTLDFVVGSRFHGAMVAIQRGIPALVICHDTRTTEMCKFLGLPHVGLMDIDEFDIRDLASRVDPVAMQSRYRELYPAYKSFLDKNGLPHNLT